MTFHLVGASKYTIKIISRWYSNVFLIYLQGHYIKSPVVQIYHHTSLSYRSPSTTFLLYLYYIFNSCSFVTWTHSRGSGSRFKFSNPCSFFRIYIGPLVDIWSANVVKVYHMGSTWYCTPTPSRAN